MPASLQTVVRAGCSVQFKWIIYLMNCHLPNGGWMRWKEPAFLGSFPCGNTEACGQHTWGHVSPPTLWDSGGLTQSTGPQLWWASALSSQGEAHGWLPSML